MRHIALIAEALYSMKKILLAVVGPTAIGKTSLSISLANHFNTEIVSADSRQFFKEMRIGTAVPSARELNDAQHHLIQHKSIVDNYSVGAFEREALQLITNLHQKNEVILLVGGSGLYIKAVTEGLDYFPKIDPNIRSSLSKKYEEKGITYLQEQLKKLDPTYFERVDLANPHRIIRALEVCIGSGECYSKFIGQPKAPRPFKTITLGLDTDRKIIYDRINDRVDIMMKTGLLDEVKKLYPFKDLNALQTVGYRELFKYLDGTYDLDFAVAEIKKNTRRFAKRQLTWFKKNEDTIWVPYDSSLSTILETVEAEIKKHE